MAHILVIDDDEEICRMLQELLSSEGHEVDIANGGQEGIDHYRRLPSDLVITDIYMPKMNGIELIQNIRQLDSKINIVAMSGDFRNHNHNSLEWAKAMGALEIIEKPFDHQDFVSKVQAIIHE